MTIFNDPRAKVINVSPNVPGGDPCDAIEEEDDGKQPEKRHSGQLEYGAWSASLPCSAASPERCCLKACT